ncbi:MAG: hypothetical protein HS108_05180 [Planctomycetes bacterium]|jgi:hypothetical protein|nr:hypothetical protein [Planctomycetota bacterium]MCL4730737.1 hypothetical protein [Planctomycetota bacterium]
MWDRSFRWQRWARLGAGALALVAAGAGAVSFAQTAPAARARAGLAEIARETNPDAQARVSVELPAGLGARRGGLVYRENSDGSGDIVGRVIDVAPAGADTQRVTILLTPAASGMLAHGGKVRGAAPTLNVEHALRLLVSPDIPRDEATRARDAIWPAVEKAVLPGLKERLTTELTQSMDNLAPEDAELLNATVGDLRKELAPLEEQLLNKLANRAWEVIGVSGVAEGVLRKAGDGAKNTYNDAKEWVKGWFGKKEEVERQNRDFLTEEKATALRIALEEEVEKFLKDNDREIKAAFNKVLNERRRDFIQKFETRWGPKLYEKAIVPSWFDGEDAVIAAAESYANDFARRRLLTERGGPRLLLAYALRTSLDISDDPLLVIAPARTGTVEFEWIMPRLAKDSR